MCTVAVDNDVHREREWKWAPGLLNGSPSGGVLLYERREMSAGMQRIGQRLLRWSVLGLAALWVAFVVLLLTRTDAEGIHHRRPRLDRGAAAPDLVGVRAPRAGVRGRGPRRRVAAGCAHGHNDDRASVPRGGRGTAGRCRRPAASRGGQRGVPGAGDRYGDRPSTLIVLGTADRRHGRCADIAGDTVRSTGPCGAEIPMADDRATLEIRAAGAGLSMLGGARRHDRHQRPSVNTGVLPLSGDCGNDDKTNHHDERQDRYPGARAVDRELLARVALSLSKTSEGHRRRAVEGHAHAQADCPHGRVRPDSRPEKAADANQTKEHPGGT